MSREAAGGPVLLGGGALARDLVDLVGESYFSMVFVEPEYDAPELGLPVVRSLIEARNLTSVFVLAVADSRVRRRLVNQAIAADLRPAQPVISKHSVVARNAQLGLGSVIGHNAVVGPSAIIGDHVLLMHCVVIGHDSAIDENVLVCAGASIAGGVKMGPDCFVGPNATIAPQVCVGEGAFIAAGAACLKDIAAQHTAIGNPARSYIRKFEF